MNQSVSLRSIFTCWSRHWRSQMSLVLWCACISPRDMQLVYTLLFSLYSIPLSIPFTGYTSPLHRLYYLYLFALSTNTQAQELYVCTIHTSTWTLSTFLVDINTVTINAHCTIGSDLSCICKHPTHCEHVLPMCMWFMYICLWVAQVHKCISYWMT